MKGIGRHLSRQQLHAGYLWIGGWWLPIIAALLVLAFFVGRWTA